MEREKNMIIIDTDADGKTTITREEDLPSNYECTEWQAYEAACIKAEATGATWTEEQQVTYAAYRSAQERN